MRSVQFIILTGLGGDVEHWNPAFLSKLQELVPNSKTALIDFPGGGSLYQEEAPFTMSGNLEHMRNQVQTKGIQGPFVLIAESMGGMLATHWAKKYPNEVDGLILISTSFGGFNPFYHRLRPSSYLKGAHAALFAKTKAQECKTRFQIVINNAKNFENEFPRLLDLCIQRPQKLPNLIKQLISAATYVAPKKSPPKVPLFLMTGAKDRLVNPECSRVIHRYWGGELAIHPTGGHMLATDEPDWCAEKISSWVKYNLKNI